MSLTSHYINVPIDGMTGGGAGFTLTSAWRSITANKVGLTPSDGGLPRVKVKSSALLIGRQPSLQA